MCHCITLLIALLNRLGPNFHQIPVNAPKCPVMHPTMRDGPFCFTDNGGGAPNYWPNSFGGLTYDPRYKEHVDHLTGDVDRFDSANDDNYEQVTDFWTKVLTPDHRERLVNNIAGHLKHAEPFLQERAVKQFDKVHHEFGSKLRLALNMAKVSSPNATSLIWH